MRKLERDRSNGRDDYPVRAMWNAIIAGIVYQHPSIESLRRELSRNGQLRYVYGFRNSKALSAAAFTRFLQSLSAYYHEVERIFNTLIEEAKDLLPGFGKTLPIDGKAIGSHARRKNKRSKRDGRRDLDADYGTKTYRGTRKDGTVWETVKSWLGYKPHLIIDADYELPVAYKVTRASRSEMPEAHNILDKLSKNHPDIMENCDFFLGDRRYDDSKLVKKLWDKHRIKPVIGIRNLWKDGEKTRLPNNSTNVVYDYQGTVYCYCPVSGVKREMAYGGFEKDRLTLKYRCPAKHYRIECKGKKSCPVRTSVRVPLALDRSVFTLLAPRSSYRFETEYKKRTAVERVNSRLDVSFGFENHFIRGLERMNLRVGLSLIVMLGMAVGRVKEKQAEKLRSLVKPA